MLLTENYDPHGKHMEYKDPQGVVCAKMARVHKHGWLMGLISPGASIYAEMKDAQDNLLLTATTHYGDTRRETKVEINRPNGTLFGIVYDAPFGADFELPDRTVVGRARRSKDLPADLLVVLYTYTDASGQVVGTCDRRYSDESDRSDSIVDLLAGNWGRSSSPMQIVDLQVLVEPTLHTFLFLFPAMQNIRSQRSSYNEL